MDEVGPPGTTEILARFHELDRQQREGAAQRAAAETLRVWVQGEAGRSSPRELLELVRQLLDAVDASLSSSPPPPVDW
jgi:hypothetical protein